LKQRALTKWEGAAIPAEILAIIRAAVNELAGDLQRHKPPTNGELARRYGISARTVVNWRTAGCPFADGQQAVLRWAVRRRYLPAPMETRFKSDLCRVRLRRETRKGQCILARLRLALSSSQAGG
jgi:hypothetical protein